MIFMLAGTSDARQLALLIRQCGYSLMTSVVTESAAQSLKDAGLHVRVGRLSVEDIAAYIRTGGYRVIVDASHPFAEEASKNALAGAQAAGVSYIRYERESMDAFDHPLITVVKNYEDAAAYARKKGGVVMLTTGGKTLQVFTEQLLELPGTTLIIRLLPQRENMEKCEQLGVAQKNIVAMQGPFSKELNRALYEHYQVTLMITKESGKIGAVDEKVDAAVELGIEVVIIARPQLAYGTCYTKFTDVIQELDRQLRGGTTHGFSDGIQTVNDTATGNRVE